MTTTTESGVRDAAVTCVATDPSTGGLLVGTDRGLAQVGSDGHSVRMPWLLDSHVVVVAVDPTGGCVAAGSATGEVCIIGPGGQASEVHLGSRVRSLAWSDDGSLLAGCSQTAGLVVLGMDGSRCFGLPPSRRWRSLAFHERSGQMYVVAAGAGGASWIDPVSGAVAHRDHSEGVATAAVVDPTGRWLAIGDLRGEVRVVDSGGGDEVAICGWPDPVDLMSWMPDGARLVVAGGDEVTCWAVELDGGGEEPDPARIAVDGTRVTALAAHPWRQVLALGTEDGRVAVWDPSSVGSSTIRQGRGGVTALQWDGFDDRLFVGTRRGGAWMPTGERDT